MADNDDYARLRRMTGEADPQTTYTDTDMERFLDDAEGEFALAAANIWAEKASGYADLVDISEAGASRKNSDLFTHAKAMQEFWGGQSSEAGALAGGGGASASTTRRINRI